MRPDALEVTYATVYVGPSDERSIVAAAILSVGLKRMLRSRNCPPLICSKTASDTAFFSCPAYRRSILSERLSTQAWSTYGCDPVGIDIVEARSGVFRSSRTLILSLEV